jgi:uncharacterized protein YkwD
MKHWMLISVVTLLLLVACGGGGGPTAPAELSPAVVEAQSAALVNDGRTARSTAPLVFDPVLSAVARAHSEAMRDHAFLAHEGPGGDSLRSRLHAAGVRFRSAGENLAQVQASSDPAGKAHGQLMNSPGHLDNLLNERFEVFGVGVAREGGTYWITQIFIDPS